MSVDRMSDRSSTYGAGSLKAATRTRGEEALAQTGLRCEFISILDSLN